MLVLHHRTGRVTSQITKRTNFILKYCAKYGQYFFALSGKFDVTDCDNSRRTDVCVGVVLHCKAAIIAPVSTPGSASGQIFRVGDAHFPHRPI